MLVIKLCIMNDSVYFMTHSLSAFSLLSGSSP